MSIHIMVSIACEQPGCNLEIAAQSNGAGVNATTVRRMADTDYGWQIVKGKERCFDHRSSPIHFHTPTGKTISDSRWGTCAICDHHDDMKDPTFAAHREEIIRKNAAELRQRGVIVWSYK